MLYYVVVSEQLEHSTLTLCILYEDCIEYVFNINVNALKCNGYFSAVWCSCAQITAMHTEWWIKWASDVGQWFQTLVEITSQGTPAKLKVTVYLRFPSMAVSLKIYDVAVVSQCCS